MLYFLIVNYYSTNYIQNLISSLEKAGNQNYQIVIVNNSPDDSSIHSLENTSVKLLSADKNLGFGGGCNLGLKYIYQQDSNAIVWMINPDTYTDSNVVDLVRNFFEIYPYVSILGTTTLTPEGKIWFAGGKFDHRTGLISSENLLDNDDMVECDWVCGCSLIVNLSRFKECPLFDPAYFLYYEDFDFCQRYAMAGHQVYITKKIIIYHSPSSITNNYPLRKIKQSTASYLLALATYTNKFIFSLRLLRLLCHALILLPIRPQAGIGKIFGILMYYYKSWRNLFLLFRFS